MKTALGIDDAGAARGGTGKLDGGLDALAATAAKVDLLQVATRQLAQAPRQLTRDLGNMALQHCRAALIQFVL
jgi:hypothetical protein